MVIGYVVNENRTKLLMCYDERLDQWLPTGDLLDNGETPQNIILENGFQVACYRHIIDGNIIADVKHRIPVNHKIIWISGYGAVYEAIVAALGEYDIFSGISDKAVRRVNARVKGYDACIVRIIYDAFI